MQLLSGVVALVSCHTSEQTRLLQPSVDGADGDCITELQLAADLSWGRKHIHVSSESNGGVSGLVGAAWSALALATAHVSSVAVASEDTAYCVARHVEMCGDGCVRPVELVQRHT